MIEFFIFLLAVSYGVYRWKKTKKENIFYSVFLVFSWEVTSHLFNLPSELAMSIWAFFGFSVILYKVLMKKVEKSFYVFSVMFFCFGIAFLMQAIQEMGYQEYIFKLFRHPHEAQKHLVREH